MKNRFKFTAILIFILILTGFNFSDDFIELLNDRNKKFNEKFPVEKVYIQTDKTLYQIGDTLWFRAYILDRANNFLSRRSAALHCLIVDASGNVVEEKSYVNINGNIQGDFVFKKSIPEGYYRVVAFTSWMKNFDNNSAFIKEFQIKQFVPQTVKFRLGFNKPLYKPSDTVRIAIQTYSSKGSFQNLIGINYQVTSGKKIIFRKKDKVVNQGLKFIQFPLPDFTSDPPYTITIKPEDEKFDFNVSSLIPTEKIDLQFFPESGDLIEGITSRLAFKALNQLGEPFDFEGKILDSKGKTIQKIKSSFKGMGSIRFTAASNESYTARITYPEGIDTEYKIPAALTAGYNINISGSTTDTIKGFLKSSSMWKEEITLTLNMRGKLLLAAKGVLNGTSTLTIPVHKLPMGVGIITLFNAANQPVAERLVYINKRKQLYISITSDKQVYKPREKITLRIKAADYNGNSVFSALSLAIVDSSLSFSNKIQSGNIVSYTTLESEIKGKVLDPAWYFTNFSYESDSALDLVLQTQGWRRFEWFKTVLQNIYEMPGPQNFDAISGTVYKKFRDRIIPNVEVNLVQLNTKDVFTTRTDKNGRFCYIPQYMDYNAGSFVVTVSSYKSFFGARIVMDTIKENFFKDNLLDYLKLQSKGVLSKDFFTYAPGQFKKIDESPLKNDDYIVLPEVLVKGLKKNDATSKWISKVETTGARVYRGEDLFPLLDLLEIIRSHRQVYIDPYESKLYFDNSFNYKQGIMFEVDGINFRSNFDFVSYLRADDIDAIAILGANDAILMYGPEAKDGAVIIKTKPYRYEREISSDLTIARSFSTPMSFYNPMYDNQFQVYALPDTRITIYWNPGIYIEKNGETIIEFYNGDHPAKITGIIEGIGDIGLVGYKTFSYDVKAF